MGFFHACRFFRPLTDRLISFSFHRFLRSVKIDLHHHPLVVATVTQQSDLDLVRSGSCGGFDLLEFRIDDLYPVQKETEAALGNSAHSHLLTVRCPEEGGAASLTPENRVELYEKFLPYSTLIDTEVISLQEGTISHLVEKAHATDVGVVASFHDFHGFPGIQKIRETIELTYELGADVAKIAVRIEDRKDLYDLAQVVAEWKNRGRAISAMGMGPLGKLSRLVLAEAGSCLNYGYLEKPNAPGQWSAQELSKLLPQVFP